MNKPCKNDKNKYSNQISSLVPAEFLAFLKTTTFDFAMLILNLWIFLIKKRHCSSKTSLNNNFTIIKCFSKGFSTYLTILKCTSKGLRMVFEKFALHSYQIWTLYNTSIVPDARKYQQNKTGTNDTDYERIKREKQELASES